LRSGGTPFKENGELTQKAAGEQLREAGGQGEGEGQRARGQKMYVSRKGDMGFGGDAGGVKKRRNIYQKERVDVGIRRPARNCCK